MIQLVTAKAPPIQQVIECGVIPRFVELMQRDDCPKLQFEATWALTNIASGSSEQTAVVVDSGAVQVLILNLVSADEDVREQCVWALGNIAGDSVQNRNMLLRMGAMSSVLALERYFNESTRPTFGRVVAWSLSNLCRGKPSPDFYLISPAIPFLSKLINSIDDETAQDACW